MNSFYNERQLELNFEGKKNISENKHLFIEKMIRAAQFSNFQIEEDAKVLRKIVKAFSNSSGISKFQKIQIQDLSNKYGISTDLETIETSELASLLDELTLRVELVPIRLVLAQAITESAWGESRFAKEGEAYFGIHCYEEACGMRIGNTEQKVFVKTYSDLQASVEDYMLFLNSKPGTKKFRNVRHLYLTEKEVDMNALVESLDSYSEIGGQYFAIIKDLLNNYIPDSIDNY